VIVVADAGPVLHLHWIGCLSWGLPPTSIHVVEQVWVEITQHAPEALGDPRLKRQEATEIDSVLRGQFSLQLGEAAAISFALRHQPALLLTDDEAARRACASVTLEAVGTIGLILEAARSKRVRFSSMRTMMRSRAEAQSVPPQAGNSSAIRSQPMPSPRARDTNKSRVADSSS
jgi:predicted nucleic acid-binding protein